MNAFLAEKDVLGVLFGLNPWWMGGVLPEVPRFHRLAYHVCRAHLADAHLRRAVLLSGPRRVGKTTILTQIARALVEQTTPPRTILYLTLDHPLLKLAGLRGALRVFHANVCPEGQPVVLLLDEVHYCRDWELELKHLIDHRPNYRILATGSASLLHRDRLAESGVGRWVRVPIPTLSFHEFLHIRGEDTSCMPSRLRPMDLLSMDRAELLNVANRATVFMPAFQRYLLVGGFPETATHPDLAFCQRLLREDVVERVLKRDMTALFGIRNVDDLEKLFIYLCLHTGGILAVQTCAKELGVSPITVANHLAALEQANLIYRLNPTRAGGKKILKVRQKMYLVDAALRNAVLLRGEESLGQPADVGVVVETTVLRHCYAYYYRDTPEILYWRDPASGNEVDIIVRSPRYTIPIEVKYREHAELDESAGLAAFCRAEQVPFAYWVVRQPDQLAVTSLPGLETRFLQVPAHIFTYLLGQAERLLWDIS